jgi:nucleolar protein 4
VLSELLLWKLKYHELAVPTELANVSDRGSDEESEDNLVGEDDSYELEQETSNCPADDFKTEMDISRKVLENLIKSSERAEPSGNEGSDIDTDTETEQDTSEKKQKQTHLPTSVPAADKLENSKRVAQEENTLPATKFKKQDAGLDRTLFISNLPFDLSNEEVTERFSAFGKVESFFPVLHKLTKYVSPSVRTSYFLYFLLLYQPEDICSFAYTLISAWFFGVIQET